MNSRLESIERDYNELEVSLGSPEVLGDQNRLREASRKYKQLTPLVQCIRDLWSARGDAAAAKELMIETTGDERESFRAEATAADTTSLEEWVGFKPATPIAVGIANFVSWYRQFYAI
ncbi:PCRF domain-containing protein [uncultured Synechococcus sp.]|uniref:PCRF domain-containing protein n=1 Tax=uncultured Synechococcus sp. TaxID=154535 RepID=UPI0033904F7C